MSCPDWKTLAAWREDPRAGEPAGWGEALAHFDRGCAGCRRAALAADPTLVFRRLAAPPTPELSPVQEASEVESMRRAVAAMRAASRVEAVERHGRPRRAIKALGWKRWAAAAALAMAALSMPSGPASAPGGHLRRAPLTASPAGILPAVFSTAGPEAAAFPPAVPDDLPTLEGVDRPGARVYHMDGDGLSVTMIFDETMDV
jgi:hypothetical protein